MNSSPNKNKSVYNPNSARAKRLEAVRKNVASRTTNSFNKLALSDSDEDNKKKFNYKCHVCNGSIDGIRWSCVTCVGNPPVNLCNVCYEKGRHSSLHTFYKINKNGERQLVQPKQTQGSASKDRLTTLVLSDSSSSTSSVEDHFNNGKKHKGYSCYWCHGEIFGTRWKCNVCYDCNYCTNCYNTKKHPTDHTFHKIDTPGGRIVEVEPKKPTSEKGDINTTVKNLFSNEGKFNKAKFFVGEHEVTLVELLADNKDYLFISNKFISSMRIHKGGTGGNYSTFKILRIHRVQNKYLLDKYERHKVDIACENKGDINEKHLFHCSPVIDDILKTGFDERHSNIGGMFGAGCYFADHSSKSNQYVYGCSKTTGGCELHRNYSCYVCVRKMLLCKVMLGKVQREYTANKKAHAPVGHHSVEGVTRAEGGSLDYPEYIVYKGGQAYPEYVITYQLVQ